MLRILLQELSRSLLKARLPRESLALNSFALPLNMLSQLFCNLSARFATFTLLCLIVLLSHVVVVHGCFRVVVCA